MPADPDPSEAVPQSAIFAIPYTELHEGGLDDVLAVNLRARGFDIGPMSWTARGAGYSLTLTERRGLWAQALIRAGITIEHDARALNGTCHLFRVSRVNPEC